MATKKASTKAKSTATKAASNATTTTTESSKFSEMRKALNNGVTVLSRSLHVVAGGFDEVYDTAMDTITMRDFSSNQELDVFRTNLAQLEIDLTGVGGLPPMHNHSADLEFRTTQGGAFTTVPNAH